MPFGPVEGKKRSCYCETMKPPSTERTTCSSGSWRRQDTNDHKRSRRAPTTLTTEVHSGTLLLLYGTLAYAVFLGTFLYAIGFVGCVGVAKCVDTGAVGPWGPALLIDAVLLGAFAVQHSVMARRWFKRWWIEVVPPAAERSTYVLIASLLLDLLFWQWRPLPGTVWHLHGVDRDLLWGLFALGWLVLLAGTFMIDHFDLFGLRQVWLRFRNHTYRRPPFKTTAFYHYSRNPLMLGFMIAFWAAPTMSVSRLVFAAAASGYILVGIMLEERDHAYYLGDEYRRYQERTPMLLGVPRISKERSNAGVAEERC
jgi:protein-S-isoprenylcysteine O-methyltransferase Ste14